MNWDASVRHLVFPLEISFWQMSITILLHTPIQVKSEILLCFQMVFAPSWFSETEIRFALQKRNILINTGVCNGAKGSKKKKSILHYIRGFAPKRVMSGGALLRDLAPAQHSFEDTSQRWQAGNDAVSDLIGLGIKQNCSSPLLQCFVLVMLSRR